MSFMLTTQQVRERSKTVTRRLGWGFLVPGDLVQGVEKGMGLKKGETVQRLAVIKILGTRWEALRAMTDNAGYGRAECAAEGFPHLTPAEFVAMLCKAHRGTTPETLVNRIEFNYPAKLNP
jgi:hypothetical protein